MNLAVNIVHCWVFRTIIYRPDGLAVNALAPDCLKAEAGRKSNHLELRYIFKSSSLYLFRTQLDQPLRNVVFALRWGLDQGPPKVPGRLTLRFCEKLKKKKKSIFSRGWMLQVFPVSNFFKTLKFCSSISSQGNIIWANQLPQDTAEEFSDTWKL